MFKFIIFLSMLFYFNIGLIAQTFKQITPCNPNASKETACLLKFLGDLSQKKDKKIISGQMTYNGINEDSSYNQTVNKLFQKTGKYCGLIGADYERDYPQKLTKINETNKPLIKAFKNNTLVTLMWSANNPWTGGPQNDLTASNNLLDLITPGTLANKRWIAYLDSLAKGLKELRDSGVVVLWRPLHEMNGPWFWWGSKDSKLPESSTYGAVWRHMYNYFTYEHNLNNLLWVYSTTAKSKKVSNPAFKNELFYYPGDEYVDIIGVDAYTDSLDIINYDELVNKGKILALTEYGPDRNTVLNKTEAFDYTGLINQIKTKYPDFVYWMVWNDFITNGGKDSVNYSLYSQKNAKTLLENSLVVNRGDFNFIDSCQNIPLNNGPWNNPLRIAYSTDGINFIDDKIFQDSSGVPSITQWRGDTLICAFQWFRAPQNSSTWDKVAVKFSYDRGKTWTEPKPIIVNGLPQGYQRPFDPTLTVTADNKIRIYFSSSATPVIGLDSMINTYSAISYDGINYIFEPGARFDHKTQRVIDPAVIRFNGEWHYLSPAGAPQDGAFHCVSPDAINFTEKAKILSDNQHNWTGNYSVDNEQELRFYGCGENIWFNTSYDGYKWTGYTKTNVNGGDPSVSKVAINKYIMVYVGLPYDQNDLINLLKPDQGITINQDIIPFSWKVNLPKVAYHHIQISHFSDFSNLIINDSIFYTPKFELTWVEPDTIYYWRVRVNSKDVWSDWSEVRFFRTGKINDIIELNTKNEIIFPNPTIDYINLPKQESIGEASIYSDLGELIIKLDYKERLDVSFLSPGSYYLIYKGLRLKFLKY